MHLRCHWSEFLNFIFKKYKPSLVKLPIHLGGENGSFIRFWTISAWYPPAKKGDNYCTIIVTSPNVIGFATGNSLHCEDMAQGGIKHGGRYCVAGGPNKVSCKNTSYTPGISMHRFPDLRNNRPTGRRIRWPLSTSPAGQIQKKRDCVFLVSVVAILFHSIRVLSEDIALVKLRT